jgi:hypothetical protein
MSATSNPPIYVHTMRSILLDDNTSFTVTYWRPDKIKMPQRSLRTKQAPMERKRGKTICSTTGKLRYGTRDKAEREIAKAIISGNPYRRETRAYECEHCGMWHLTSLRKVPPLNRSRSSR